MKMHMLSRNSKNTCLQTESKECVEVGAFSCSHTNRQERVTTGVTVLDNIPSQNDISGYNTAEYDGG